MKTFTKWLNENSLDKISKQSPQFPPGTTLAPRGDCPFCSAPKRPDTGEQLHNIDCPEYSDWVRRRVIARRKK